MIKSLILIGLSFTASFAAAVDGDNLIPSLEDSIDLYGSNESIVSWETKISANTVEVKLLTEEGIVENFECSSNDCASNGSQAIQTEITNAPNYDLMVEAQTYALRKLERSLARKDETLRSMKLVKTWIEDDSTEDHGDGSDIWTKVIHTLGSKTMNIFVLCHKHGREMYCHYRRDGVNEPQF